MSRLPSSGGEVHVLTHRRCSMSDELGELLMRHGAMVRLRASNELAPSQAVYRRLDRMQERPCADRAHFVK